MTFWSKKPDAGTSTAKGAPVRPGLPPAPSFPRLPPAAQAKAPPGIAPRSERPVAAHVDKATKLSGRALPILQAKMPADPRRAASVPPGRPLQAKAASTMVIAVRVETGPAARPAASPGPKGVVIQPTKCDVYIGTSNRGSGEAPLKTKAHSHAERKAFAKAEKHIATKVAAMAKKEELLIEFQVDTSICDACCKWFDQTVQPAIAKSWNKKGTLTVRVTVGDNHVDLPAGGSGWKIPGNKSWAWMGEGY